MFALKFAFLLASIVFCAILLAASAPATNDKRKVVYRRYQRRRPSVFPSDFYVDEYLEVFHTKQKPPMYRLSDEDVDRIIRCDFDPTRKECEELHKPMLPEVPFTTPKSIATSSTTTSTQAPTTTTRAPTTPSPTTTPLFSTTSLPSTSTQTTTIESLLPDLPFLPEIRTTTTTTTELPLLPDVPLLSNELPEENAIAGDVEEIPNTADNYDDGDDDDDDYYDNENDNDKYNNTERDTELEQEEDYADEEDAEDKILK